MVALRGNGGTINSLSYTSCTSHGTRSSSHNVQHNIHSSISVQQAVAHINRNNSVNLQNLNSVSIRFLHSQNNCNLLKQDSVSPPTRYSRGNCVLPSHHYRVLARRRAECYHPPAGAGPTYLPSGTPVTTPPSQQAMRVQSAQQPSVPLQSQQDLSKNTMSAHNFVGSPNQAPTARQQFANFPQYRPTQRSTSHQRQQTYMAGSGTGSSSMMFHPQHLMYPAHMGMQQSFQQQRNQQYYPYLTQYVNYNSTAGPTPSYYAYPSAAQQMPTPGLTPNSGSRSNSAPLVQPGAPTNPNTTAASMPHLGQSQHQMHQNMSTLRATKRIHRVPIINPDTQQEISITNDNADIGSDSSERQTPQPENANIAKDIVKEFARRVSEMANQPSTLDDTTKATFAPKPVELTMPIQHVTNTLQTPCNAIPIASNNNNNDILKSDILTINESKTVGPEVVPENVDTPIVSALSDSPEIEIVPKLCPAIKKAIKHSEPPPAVDNVEDEPASMAQKPNIIPIVPQNEDDIASLPTAVPDVESHSQDTSESLEVGSPKDASIIEKDLPEMFSKVQLNGPAILPVLDNSAIDSPLEPIISSTSVSETLPEQDAFKQSMPEIHNEKIPAPVEVPEPTPVKIVPQLISPIDFLTASLGTLASRTIRAPIVHDFNSDTTDFSNTAQAKLQQSLNVYNRSNQADIKDINLNVNNTDFDTANGNAKDTSDFKTERNNIKINVEVSSEASYENGKDVIVKEENTDDKPTVPPVFVPKYRYSNGQWSPVNTTGKKRYDLNLLKQIKDDPLSKQKPNAPKLEMCKVLKVQQEPMFFTHLGASRPTSDALFPNFLKPSGGMSKNIMRDAKKDGRSIIPGKGSIKLNSSPGVNSQMKHNVIHVSLSMREDVKLNESENAWKPTRFKKDQMSDEEYKTQDLYKKFRGILNKLTPQKFDTLLDKIKLLKIDTQKRLEGVIDLVFEKAIDEPNFSEAYAAMCNKLSTIKVPMDGQPEQCVNFRALIISKCQAQFVTNKSDIQMQKLEKDIVDCTESGKRKELQAQLEEESRRIRMRSVGNVRFIGELYKLKMLIPKIMMFCMEYLIVDKLEEEKLECLCKLLTTIGEQVEGEVTVNLDLIFRKMQDIVDKKSNRISSRVRFMLQDVIALRRRKWVTKTVVDLQPRMMDQIQKEAEQQHRQTELLNSSMGNYRRDDGGRGKRGDSRRQNQNSFMDNNSSSWKSTKNSYSVDTSKFKAVTHKTLENIKLAPQKSQWGHGSSTKTTTNTVNSVLNLGPTTANKYSVLENVQTDPTALRGNKDLTAALKGASIERSSFNSRGDFSSASSSRSGSVTVSRPTSGSHSTNASAVRVATPPPSTVEEPAIEAASVTTATPQEPLTDQQNKLVKSIIDQCLLNPVDNEMTEEIKSRFEKQYHAGVVAAFINIALEKPAKDLAIIAKSVHHLVSTNVIEPQNFVLGLTEVLEFAPDIFIDIPMLYNNICLFIVPQIEKKNITISHLFNISENIVAAGHGPLLLKSVLIELKTSMGPSFVKSKWQESKCTFVEWMSLDKITKFLESNNLQFIESLSTANDQDDAKVTQAEAFSKLVQLMHSDESCECIRGWVQDNLGKASNEDWFMQTLIKAVCEYVLFGSDVRGIPHFNKDRMNKYAELINEFGESKPVRESNCLFGIQQMIRQLEHPQGLSLEIFQYLHEQYIISVEGFLAWEKSEKEPEGKGVMMKALTSFFTSIKEADNEDSLSED